MLFIGKVVFWFWVDTGGVGKIGVGVCYSGFCYGKIFALVDGVLFSLVGLFTVLLGGVISFYEINCPILNFFLVKV